MRHNKKDKNGLTEEDILLKKPLKEVEEDPLDWHLNRPLTEEELAGFGKQTQPPLKVSPFFRIEQHRGLCPVVGIKWTF